MDRVPTRSCPRCGREYAVACPACPYCDWVPLRPGFPRWLRLLIVLPGLLVSAAVAFLFAGLWQWVFLIGCVLTFALANRLVGGGKYV